MSISLSFGSDNADQQRPYYVGCDSYDPKLLLHCARRSPDPKYQLKRLGQLLEQVKTDGVQFGETLVAMEQSVTGNRSFGLMLIDNLHENFVAGKPIFGHSLLPVDQPVKAYFDIDMPVTADQLTRDAVTLRLRRAINFLSQSAGFDPDWEEWAILVCPYDDHPTASNKFSAHLIYQRWSFKGPTVLKKWLDEHIDWKVAQEEHGFDPQPYKTNQTFRLPGGSRFVALTNRRAALEEMPKHYPFVFFSPDTHHQDLTWAEYASALPGYVPGRCQRIDVQGGSQMIARAQNVRPGYQGTLPGKVIARLQEWGREEHLNLDMDYFRISNNDDDPINTIQDEVSFHLKGYDGFLSCRHASEDILVKLYPQAEVFYVCCGECGDLPAGLTQRSSRFLAELEFISFLADFGLTRPDFCFPGTARSPGHYAQTSEDFYKSLRATRRGEYDSGQFICSEKNLPWLLADEEESAVPLGLDGRPLPVPFLISGTNAGGVFNLEMVEFLNNLKPPGPNGISNELISYVNCFAACVGKNYYLSGIGEKTKMQMGEFMAPLKCYAFKKPKATKKDPDPDWIRSSKPIFDLWKEHGGRRTYKSFHVGALDFSLMSQMNALEPVAYDLEECLTCYGELDLPTQTTLLESYKVLIEMYVYTEPNEEIKQEMRHAFHRFYHANIFHFWKRKTLAMCLSSDKGGQGKSWGGEMIGKMVGSGYYKSFDGAGWNADKFNQVNGLNVLNELEFKSAKDASELKSRITADAFSDRKMYKSAVHVENLSSFWIAINETKLEGLTAPGMERRLMVTKLLEVDMYDAVNLLHYHCPFCNGEECGHSFYSHSDLFALLRDNIFPNPDAVKAYIGMLYHYFASLEARSPELWERPLGTFCPQTEAGLLLRKRNENSVDGFFDDCVERGVHFSTKITPPPNSGFKTIYLTKTQTQRLAADVVTPDSPPTWETHVAEQSLYAAYRWKCQETGAHSVPIGEFNEGFKKYYRERVVRGTNPSLQVKDVFQHEWRKDEMGSIKWVVSTNPCLKMKVWTMGPPWTEQMKLVEAQRKLGGGRLNKSRSGLFSSLSRSSFGSSPEHRPLNYPPPHRQVEGASIFEVDSQQEQYLGRLAMVIDDEDANDGFDPGFNNPRQLIEPDSSSEEGQDRRAAFDDTRPRKKNRFLDIEAEVDDDIDEEEEELARDFYD